MKKTSIILCGIIISLLAVLTACVPVASVDSLIKLQAKEKWAIEIQLAFNSEDAAVNQAVIEQTIGQAVEGLAAQGMETSWKRDDGRGAAGSAVYVIDVKGQGFDLLNRFVFQQFGAFSILRVANNNQIVISMTPQASLAQVPMVRYTVQGGEILTTNGSVFDPQTVYWINPNGRMEATLQEPGGINWLTWGLIAVGMILLGISIPGLIHLGKRKPVTDITDTQPTRAAVQGIAICNHCQAEIPAEAIYCPNCGKQR